MLINRCRLTLLPPDVVMDRALTVTMLFGVTLHDLLIRPELPSIPVVAGMITFMARCQAHPHRVRGFEPPLKCPSSASVSDFSRPYRSPLPAIAACSL